MIYEYWLASVHPLSDCKKKRLREIYGSAKAIYYIEETELLLLTFLDPKDVGALADYKKEDPEKLWERLEKKNIRFVPYFDKEYPQRLTQISHPPYALYVKGRLPSQEAPSVAIVGARNCTPYGERMALEYGEKLALSGIQIISGMARGIDGAAQRGALNGNGRTYGILGCGVDVCYPREHIGLYMDIQDSGGLLSEKLPGQPPLPAYFPERNRIISGLSDTVLVLEARERSGSLITADLALEQGKDVYALPGPVSSPVSQGCHRLIKQGAGILISPQDLLRDMEVGGIAFTEKSDKNKKMLESPENIVYSCLDLFPKSIGQLAEETDLPSQELLERLITLELKGFIEEISKNYYIRRR